MTRDAQRQPRAIASLAGVTQASTYFGALAPILILSLLLSLAGLGQRSPWPADEPRFAEVAREMVETGDWLIPRRGGEPYPDKPPVFMWSIAALHWSGLDLDIAFLIPNALCSAATLWLLFDLAYRLWNLRLARRATLLLLLAPQFLLQAKSGQIDAMVACWIAFGFYGLMRHFFAGPAWGWYYAAWAFMGLGIITKGVGFLPALLLLPMAGLRYARPERFRGRLDWRRAAWGPFAMIAVAALWIVPMYLHVEAVDNAELFQYRDNILFKQTSERYANSWGHLKPWHYFLSSVIPLLWFPLPFVLIAKAKRLAALLKSDPALLATCAWTALVIVFFSLSPGKRGVYLLPALPAFALAVAVALDDGRPVKWLERALSAFQGLLALVFLGLGAVAASGRIAAIEPSLAENLDPATGRTLGLMLLLMGASWGASLLLWRRQGALKRQFAAMAATWLALSLLGFPALEPLRTPKPIFDTLSQSIPRDSELGLIAFREQFILFSPIDVTHFGYAAPLEEQERNAWLWMKEKPGRFLLVPGNLELHCFDTASAPSMGYAHRRDWLLVSPMQMAHACESPDRQLQYTTPAPAAAHAD